MINAEEARAATMKSVEKIAKEFIWNNVGTRIQEEIDSCHFFATVSFEGVSNAKVVGAKVVELLEDLGYEAKHEYYDGPNGYDNYILIKWENNKDDGLPV